MSLKIMSKARRQKKNTKKKKKRQRKVTPEKWFRFKLNNDMMEAFSTAETQTQKMETK